MYASSFLSPPVTIPGCTLAGKKGSDYKRIPSKFKNEKPH